MNFVDGMMLGARIGAGLGIGNAVVKMITGTGFVDYTFQNIGLGFFTQNGGQ